MLKEFHDEDVTFDEQLGKITYQNVDMFYKKDKISDILKLGYDYYIYDFGTYRPDDFVLISFLEKNHKICSLRNKTKRNLVPCSKPCKCFMIMM